MYKPHTWDDILMIKTLWRFFVIKLKIFRFMLIFLVILIFWNLMGFNNNKTNIIELNNRLQVFVYGTYYDEVLLPGFNNSCITTQNINIQRGYDIPMNFDIFIVHFKEFETFMNKYLSKKTEGKKIMILFALEAPIIINGGFQYHRSSKYFTHWACSYMRTSYFYFPYGSYIKKTNGKSVPDYSTYFLQKESKALVIISNCNGVETVRADYVNELKRHFPVETYGGCYGRRITNSERIDLIKKYKFYLSFENCCSVDYITEKYWNPIKYGAIAVVMADSKPLTSLIPGSYINVFDFPNPRKLAEYLKFVSTNETEYLKYFEWRDKYTPQEFFESDHCKLLDKINYYIRNPSEDPTIFQIGNISLTIPRGDLRRLIMK